MQSYQYASAIELNWISCMCIDKPVLLEGVLLTCKLRGSSPSKLAPNNREQLTDAYTPKCWGYCLGVGLGGVASF